MMVYELDNIERVALMGQTMTDIQMARVEAGELEAEWRYEFRPNEKYKDLGIYTILALAPPLPSRRCNNDA